MFFLIKKRRLPKRNLSVSNLATITFPEKVKSTNLFGYSVFVDGITNCLNLKSIQFPDCDNFGIYSISWDGYAFSGCSNLESIRFPKGGNAIASSVMGGTSILWLPDFKYLS